MFSSEKWFGASADFYPETIDQSLRFEDGDTPRLSKTFGSGGDRKNWTWSAWVKRANLGINGTLFHTFAQGGFGIEGFIAFTSSDTISYQFDYNGGSHIRLITNRVFRDSTSWFHLCCVADSDNSTQGDRIRMYINGVRETSFSSENYPNNTTTDGSINSTHNHYIGGRTNNTTMFDGYLAEVNFLDGVAVTDTSGVLDELVEIKNGVCIPKKYSGSYGTTGFRFTFADSSSLGDDTSGLSTPNDFASSGLASTDVVIDSPTNNFCTFNPLNAVNSGQATFFEGNLRIDSTASNRGFTTGTFKLTGKHYFEVFYKADTSGFIGIQNISNNAGGFTSGQSIHIFDGSVRIDGSSIGSATSFSVGDVIGVQVDINAKSIEFFKNGVSVSSNTYTIDAEYFPFIFDSSGGRAMDLIANFGQDASFAGNKTSGSDNASDSNGQGIFFETPASGFLALCSSNLEDTSLSPNQSEQATDYFNTKVYSGTGSNNNAITGVGFQPDWLWIKVKSTTGSHYAVDSSRGLGTGDSMRAVTINSTSSEFTAENDQVRSFDADGFTLDDNTDNTYFVNRSGDSYVSWNWKANGGTTSSNTVGTISSTVQTSTEAGFSIVTYTGNGSNGTIGHSLGKIPQMMIVKKRNASGGSWIVYHHEMGTSPEDLRMFLDSSDASGTSTANFNSTAPTSTVFSVGNTTATNGSSNTYVAYLFAGIDGYSKFGSYTGNGSSTNGTYVFTGFSVSWLMVKRTNSTGSWSIYDNKRNLFNLRDKRLVSNLNNAEATTTAQSVNFLSNGFKLMSSNTDQNGSGSTYIYMAFSDGGNFKFGNSL